MHTVSTIRIVSLSPAATETLSLLGLEDEIVGITPWCSMYLNNPSGKEIAGTYLDIRFDVLSKLAPDVVFLQSRVHDNMFREVRSRGFNAYLLPLPTNVYAIISHIVVDIGSVVGRYYEARELAEKLLDEVRRLVRLCMRRCRRRVYVEYLWPDRTFSTAGCLTYVDDGIRIAGGENIYHDVAREFFNPKDEETAARDPEVVLVNIEPPWEGLTVEQYKEMRSTLSSTKAFKESRILLVKETKSVNLAHFGPSFVSTIDWICRNI